MGKRTTIKASFVLIPATAGTVRKRSRLSDRPLHDQVKHTPMKARHIHTSYLAALSADRNVLAMVQQ
jgi:hypothetical protein